MENVGPAKRGKIERHKEEGRRKPEETRKAQGIRDLQGRELKAEDPNKKKPK